MREVKGFSLLEILAVLLIIGIIGSIAIPNLRFASVDGKRKEFVIGLESLIEVAWQQALRSQQLYRVFFDLRSKNAHVERVIKATEPGQKDTYEPIDVPYARAQFQIPDSIQIRQFFIQGSDFLNQPGTKIDTLWFYVVPDGLVQEVIVNAIDLNELDEKGKGRAFSLVLNPFTARLKEYDSFQKP